MQRQQADIRRLSNILFGIPGSTEGPWNHTKRLEKLLGPRLRVIGLIDLNEEAAKRRIAEKLKGPAKSSWKDTQVFTNVHAAGESLTSQLKPQ